MADFLVTVESDRGPLEPLPVTLVSQGQEVSLSGSSGISTSPRYTSRLLSSLGSNNLTLVRSSPVQIFLIDGMNNSQAGRYLKLYNKSSSPVLASDFPVMTFFLEASAPFSIDLSGYYFTVGLSYALTTGAADNDTGALTSGDITAMNITYLY